MQLGQEIEELVAQILTAEDGTSWRCDYEPPAVGVRGLVVFTSEDGERRRRVFSTFGSLVDEGRADPDRLRIALAEARPCPQA